MKKKGIGWYPISFIGGLTLALYGLVPVYIVYADSLGILSDQSRIYSIGGMLFIIGCVVLARSRGHKIFSKHPQHSARSGFTLIELLIVISIIGVLSSLIYPLVNAARAAAYTARAKAELREVAIALEYMVSINNTAYPADVNRDLPAGIEQYLSPGQWPDAPWPGGVYDWDAWAPGDLSHPPYEQVYQISIRFCPINEPTQCTFPNESWAQDFDYYSAFYYCVSGPCRAHSSQPTNHPAYCVNC